MGMESENTMNNNNNNGDNNGNNNTSLNLFGGN